MDSRELRLNDLPVEMLQHIFAFLPHQADRKTLSLVCRQWNDLAFDYSYLRRIKLKVLFDDHTKVTVKKLPKITRPYRNIHVRYFGDFLRSRLDEGETEQILAWFESLSSALEELVCWTPAPDILGLWLLPVCPVVKKVQLLNFGLVDDEVEEIVIPAVRYLDVFHLAPDLRWLDVYGAASQPRTIIQKLPPQLEHLQLRKTNVSLDVLHPVTQLTSVSVDDFVDQKTFEQLCELSPLLTKLRIFDSEHTPFRCLVGLTHLKVLSLCNVDIKLLTNSDICLPYIEIVEFILRSQAQESMYFDSSMRRVFPNVHYLKFGHNCDKWQDGLSFVLARIRISHGFPHVTTVKISSCRCRDDVLDLLEGLTKLRELILDNLYLEDYELPLLLNVQQLTLKQSTLEVSDEMANILPNLQFVNVRGRASKCNNAEKLPPGCSVRQYLRECVEDVFDVI